MELKKIKQFVKNNGDKFVIVEDGEPSLVVMSFHEYEKMLAHGTHESSAKYGMGRDYDIVAASFETERLKQREQEMGVWNREHEEDGGILPSKRADSIRLEDLPL